MWQENFLSYLHVLVLMTQQGSVNETKGVSVDETRSGSVDETTGVSVNERTC